MMRSRLQPVLGGARLKFGSKKRALAVGAPDTFRYLTLDAVIDGLPVENES